MDLVYSVFLAFTTVGKLGNLQGLLNLSKPKEKNKYIDETRLCSDHRRLQT